MGLYEVQWQSQGTATVEADDGDEAESILKESLENFETVQLEAIDVTGVEITSTEWLDE